MSALEFITLPVETPSPTRTFHRGHYVCHEGRARYTAFLARQIASVSKGPILDVGCGVGHLLSALADLRIPATGFDLAHEAVERAREDPRTRVTQHDANESWPFTDESFDVVTMFDVIEHFIEYSRALDEAHRVLHANGHLFVVTVNRMSILRWLLGSAWGALKDPEHVVYFDRPMLRGALRKAEFAVEGVRTFFNFGIAGESADLLRPFRFPGVMVFCPEFGDSIYVRARKD